MCGKPPSVHDADPASPATGDGGQFVAVAAGSNILAFSLR